MLHVLCFLVRQGRAERFEDVVYIAALFLPAKRCTYCKVSRTRVEHDVVVVVGVFVLGCTESVIGSEARG